ncbi:MAG: hypothetical protein ACP5HQ_01675 [Thermoprotei archaeon]
MNIVATCDTELNIKPLDEAEIIALIKEYERVVEQYENSAYGISKEATMHVILQLQPDAIIVGPQFLCPGSYMMSVGQVKYIVTEYDNLVDVLNNLEEVKKNVRDELDEEIYAEAHPD